MSQYPFQFSSQDPHRPTSSRILAMGRTPSYNTQGFDRGHYQFIQSQPYAQNIYKTDHRHVSQTQNPISRTSSYTNQSDFSSRYALSAPTPPLSQSTRSSQQPVEPVHNGRIQTAFGRQDSSQQSSSYRNKSSLHLQAKPSVNQKVPSAQIERSPNTIQESIVASQGQINGNRVPYQNPERPVHYTPIGGENFWNNIIFINLLTVFSSTTGSFQSCRCPWRTSKIDFYPTSTIKCSGLTCLECEIILTDFYCNLKSAPPESFPQAATNYIQSKIAQTTESLVDPMQGTEITGSKDFEPNKAATTETIIKFHSIVGNWSRSAPPGSYFEICGIKVFKDHRSLLFMVSQINGQTISEDSDSFFNRLWSIAQSKTKVISSNSESTKQLVHSSKIISGSAVSPPSSETTAKDTSTEVVSGSVISPPTSEMTELVTAPAQSAVTSSGPAPMTPLVKAAPINVGGRELRSPKEADIKRLAKDVLFALGKRKQRAVSPSKDIKNKASDVYSQQSKLVYDSISWGTTNQVTPSTAQPSEQHDNNQSVISVVTSAPVTRVTTSSPTLPVSMDPVQRNGQHLTVQGSKIDSPITSSVVPVSREPGEGQLATAPTASVELPATIGHAQNDITPQQYSSNNQHDMQQLPIPSTVSHLHLASNLRTPSNFVVESSSSCTGQMSPIDTVNAFHSETIPHSVANSTSISSRSYPSRPFSWIYVHANVPLPPFKADSSASLQHHVNVPSGHVTPVAHTSTGVSNGHEERLAINVPSSQSTSKIPSISKTSANGDVASHTLPDTGSGCSRRNLPTIDLTSPPPREPLFLPSPSTSTSTEDVVSIAKDKQKECSTSVLTHGGDKKKRKRRHSVYILVPPPPAYLVRYREQEAKKLRKGSNLTSVRNSSIAPGSLASRSLEGV